MPVALYARSVRAASFDCVAIFDARELDVHALRLEITTNSGKQVLEQAARVRAFPAADFGAQSMRVVHWHISEVQPGTVHELCLRGPGIEASAQCTTLPEQLPDASAPQPYIVAFGSCFHAAHGVSEGMTKILDVWQDYPEQRPDLQWFLGDQVYLDGASWLGPCLKSKRELSHYFLHNYASTFGHSDFARMLAAGGNLFLADDHEVWNNYPHAHPLAWMRGRGFWQHWQQRAGDLAEEFQSPELCWLHEFDCGASMMAIDLRLHRSSDQTRLTAPQHMRTLETWLRERKGPGILVVSQPLVSAPGYRYDRNLVDYSDFHERILPALRAAQSDLLILAGDTHFGRSIELRVDPQRGELSPKLFEVIASPLALLSPLAGRGPDVQLERFPVGAPAETSSTIRHIEQAPLRPARGWSITEEHLASVALQYDERGHLQVDLRRWLMRGTQLPAPIVASFELRGSR